MTTNKNNPFSALEAAELERAGNLEEVTNLLCGREITLKEAADLGWQLYLNMAFKSAHMVIDAVKPIVSKQPELNFALAHIKILQEDKSFESNISQIRNMGPALRAHAHGLQAAIENSFSHCFVDVVERNEYEKASQLTLLFAAVEPWLIQDKKVDNSIYRKVSDYLIATGNGGNTKLFVATDKNACTSSLAILKDETYNLSQIKPFIGEHNKTIIDIGANVGAFSTLAAHLWPTSRIISFEPGAQAFRCLNYNLRDFAAVNTHRLGLGDSNFSTMLHSSIAGSVGASIGSADCITENGEPIAVRNAGEVFAELSVQGIDILKLDTEGSEKSILAGMGALAETARIIFLEYHSEDDRRTLDALLAPTHYAFSGRIIHPHRGEFCFMRQDMAQEWDIFRIRANSPQCPDFMERSAGVRCREP